MGRFGSRLAFVVAAIVGTANDGAAQSTTLVSISSSGTPANDGCHWPAISADGRFIAFYSIATNLVLGDTNDKQDIFVHDRDADGDGVFDVDGAIETVRVSVSGAGTQADGHSGTTAISADGRFVAFGSVASNLVSGDTNGAEDVFVRDRDLDGDLVYDESGAVSTVRVSVSSAGLEGNVGGTFPALTSDGRFVAFLSSSTNLVAGDSNSRFDSFVHDRDADRNGIFDESAGIATTRVSESSAGIEGNGDSDSVPSISASGRFVAFSSHATNLDLGDPGSGVFVRDRDSDGNGLYDEPGNVETTRETGFGFAPGQSNPVSAPTLSPNGRYVAFSSPLPLPGHDPNNFWRDVYLRDRQTGQTYLASRNAAGSAGNQFSGGYNTRLGGGGEYCDGPCLSTPSTNGRLVAFLSDANNLAPGDINDFRLPKDFTYYGTDAFVHDRDADGDGVYGEFGAIATMMVSVRTDGSQIVPPDPFGEGYHTTGVALTADGRHVAFAAGLEGEVYVRDLPDMAACRAGTVNLGGGALQAVLRVNNQTSVVTAFRNVPITVSLARPTQGPTSASYALWVWRDFLTNPFEIHFGGWMLGCTGNPTPVRPDGLPIPFRCIRGGFSAAYCGPVTGPGSPASAPFSVTRAAGFARPITLSLQGIIEDDGAANGVGISTTNAVVLQVVQGGINLMPYRVHQMSSATKS